VKNSLVNHFHYFMLLKQKYIQFSINISTLICYFSIMNIAYMLFYRTKRSLVLWSTSSCYQIVWKFSFTIDFVVLSLRLNCSCFCFCVVSLLCRWLVSHNLILYRFLQHQALNSEVNSNCHYNLILTILFMTLGFLIPKTFKLFGFPIFWLWASLMKFIPETRRAH
jgi:hypothetical protein